MSSVVTDKMNKKPKTGRYKPNDLYLPVIFLQKNEFSGGNANERENETLFSRIFGYAYDVYNIVLKWNYCICSKSKC